MSTAKKVATGVATGLTSLAVTVHAAVPTVVTDAIDTAETDITTVFGAVIALTAVVLGFKWIKRAMGL